MADLFAQAESLRQEYEQRLPPIHNWNPSFSGDIDIWIARDGRWYHEGDEVKRFELAKLFSSILKREEEDYFLVTPVEKWRIQVEDAPFVVVDFSRGGSGDDQELVFKTFTEDIVLADRDHPIWVEERRGGDGQEPAPYVMVRDGMPALISRNVFYHLVDLALEERQPASDKVEIRSKGCRFSLSG